MSSFINPAALESFCGWVMAWCVVGLLCLAMLAQQYSKRERLDRSRIERLQHERAILLDWCTAYKGKAKDLERRLGMAQYLILAMVGQPEPQDGGWRVAR